MYFLYELLRLIDNFYHISSPKLEIYRLPSKAVWGKNEKFNVLEDFVWNKVK